MSKLQIILEKTRTVTIINRSFRIGLKYFIFILYLHNQVSLEMF